MCGFCVAVDSESVVGRKPKTHIWIHLFSLIAANRFPTTKPVITFVSQFKLLISSFDFSISISECFPKAAV